MNKKNQSVQGLEVIPNVFVGIKWKIIVIIFLVKNLILPVKIVLVKNLCLSLLDHSNVVCIGW